MAFAKSVKDVLPSFGHPTTVVQRVNVALTTGALAVVLPASGNLSPTVSSGRVRVKHTTNSVGSNASAGIVSIFGNDGTNSIRLYGGDTALSGNNALLDEEVSFRCDYNLINVTVTINNQNNNSNFDVELAGNP